MALNTDLKRKLNQIRVPMSSLRLGDVLSDVIDGIMPAGSISDSELATDCKVGSLATLSTTAKTSVVGAINELFGHTDSANGTKIGTLASLSTTAKNDLVSAINEVDGHADAAYVKPAQGITSADFATAVQTSLGKADSAAQAATLALTTEGNGAALIGVETITHGTGANVQALLEDLVARVYALENPGQAMDGDTGGDLGLPLDGYFGGRKE